MTEDLEYSEFSDEHDLIVGMGDEELWGDCRCGRPFGSIRPDQSLDVLAIKWERHVMTEVT